MQEDLLKAKEIIQKQKEEQSAKLKKIKKNKTLRNRQNPLKTERKKQARGQSIDILKPNKAPSHRNSLSKIPKLPSCWRINHQPKEIQNLNQQYQSRVQRHLMKAIQISKVSYINKKPIKHSEVIDQVRVFKKKFLRQNTPPTKEAANKNICMAKIK